jgi:3-deoxy-7-phosphoheptulonate synthase
VVAENIAEQIESGSNQIFGVMIESHLNDGAQKFSPGKDDPSKLEYGKSITDACINWEDSVNVLQRLALAVKNRRKAKK